MKTKGLSSLLLISIATSAQAAIIASTSFDIPTGYDDDYRDPDLTDHVLANAANPESNPGAEDSSFGTVAFTASGGEIGFSTRFVPTDFTGTNGLSDGDEIGVSTQADDNGGFTHGVQGFKMEDVDGTLITTFDTVDLTGFSASYLSLDIWVNSTGWELENSGALMGDALKITAAFEDLSVATLVDTTGEDPDDVWGTPGAPVEGEWTQLTADLSGHTSVTLAVEFSSNAGSEEIYLDNIVFSDTAPIPEPTSALLSLIGSVFLIRRRR